MNLPAHGLCVGFGKGKFREAKDGEAAFDCEKEVAFKMATAEDMVMIDNRVLTLREVVGARKTAQGAASVSYHTMKETPGDEHGFQLTQDTVSKIQVLMVGELKPCFNIRQVVVCCLLATYFGWGAVQDHAVCFKPEPGQAPRAASDSESVTVAQNCGALVMPLQFWESEISSIIWMVRWTVNGLTPIRPIVVWKVDITLSPGEAATFAKK